MYAFTDSNMHSMCFDMLNDESLSKAAVILMFTRLATSEIQ